MSPLHKYTGKKYGYLTLIHYARPGGKGKGTIWKARCDCGNEVEVVAKDVAAEKVRTCGKCQLYRRLEPSKQAPRWGASRAEKKLYESQARQALARGISWSILPSEFSKIIRESCVYCRSEPRQRKKGLKVPRNGIDRLSPSKGFTPDNTVTCCSDCKQMKAGRNYIEFLEHVVKVTENVQHLIARLENK